MLQCFDSLASKKLDVHRANARTHAHAHARARARTHAPSLPQRAHPREAHRTPRALACANISAARIHRIDPARTLNAQMPPALAGVTPCRRRGGAAAGSARAARVRRADVSPRIIGGCGAQASRPPPSRAGGGHQLDLVRVRGRRERGARGAARARGARRLCAGRAAEFSPRAGPPPRRGVRWAPRARVR